MTKPNGWTGETWRWECTAHGGLRKSTWNLLSSNGDVVLEGVKGVELVKNDKYTKLVRAAPSLYEALQAAHMALIGYLPAHRNAVTDEAIAKARARDGVQWIGKRADEFLASWGYGED